MVYWVDDAKPSHFFWCCLSFPFPPVPWLSFAWFVPPEEVAKRPDVLVIESGEVYLPGKVQMKQIGFEDHNVVYACLAETIVLTLAGRFENFTLGRTIEWEKVHEIYKLGLEHGMRLAAISGVNGVFSDEDIARVRELAVEARKTWRSPSAPQAASTTEETV